MSTKVTVAMLAALILNVAQAVIDGPDILDPIPEPWRGVTMAVLTALAVGGAGWKVNETRPAPSSWARAAELHRQAGGA